MPEEIAYCKMHGLGNAIVVVDLRGRGQLFTAAQVRRIAANPRSRFDQMLVLHAPRTPGSEAYVRIYNHDGSEAEACGNGMRCIGLLAAQQGGRRELRFETKAGLLGVTVASADRITVDMGMPKFAWADIPLAEPFDDTRCIELQIGPKDQPLLHAPAVVNIGNPHAVFFVADVAAYDLGRVGPLLENHPIFPERANISLAHVASPVALSVRTWERGVGLTKACGSAACAAVVCAARKGLAERRATVTLPGGPLEIAWLDDNRILMTGPAVVEHVGVLDALADA
jgi:diaminopimelate epimerase